MIEELKPTRKLKKRTYREAESETAFAKNARQAGYGISKKGYPDFILWMDWGKEIAVCFVEVKRRNQGLKREQKMIHGILKYFGVPVVTCYDGTTPTPDKFAMMDKQKFRKIILSL